MGFWKKALILSAFFVFCGSGFARGHSSEQGCAAPTLLEHAQWLHVVDGDTLKLKDGRKVRVLAINAPELGYDGQPHEEGAVAARAEVRRLLQASPGIQLRPGSPDQDRYGRLLADVYFADGRNLSELLIAAGLAYHIVVPPNERDWRCLAALEQQARDRQLGLWHTSIEDATPVVVKSGFQLVRGTVVKTGSSKRYLWIDLDVGLVVRIAHRDIKRHKGLPGAASLGDQLEVRGWVIDRRSQGVTLKSGYLRWMLPLRHPAMVRVIDP